MRVLLDECVPRRVKYYIADHECQTVPEVGLAGKSNGELLVEAEVGGFDVLLTVDQGMARQQNLSGRGIALLIIHARSNEIEDLLPHVPACLRALLMIRPGDVVIVE